MSARTLVRATDSRGRPVKGIYRRDGRYVAGGSMDGRWQVKTLDARTLTDAKRERESWLAGLREGRIAQRDGTTVEELFAEWQDARTISERTKAHERHLLDRHLSAIVNRRVQDVAARDLAKILRGMRDTYSSWTQVAVYRIAVGTFALAVRRKVLTASPVDGLAPSERPKQRNARRVAVLDAETMERLVTAGGSERWRAALGLASYCGLRLGEIRGLRWSDIDLEGSTLTVSRSLLPDGTPKQTKTAAGTRSVPLLPILRRALVELKLRSPRTGRDDYVICTAEGAPVAERNLRRALDAAKETAGLDGGEDRLSWHSLRHSFASLLATDLELPATTLARIVGHADAGFSLRVYAKDARGGAAVTEDVLRRSAAAGIGR